MVDGAMNTTTIGRRETRIRLLCRTEEPSSCMIIDMRDQLRTGFDPLGEAEAGEAGEGALEDHFRQ